MRRSHLSSAFRRHFCFLSAIFLFSSASAALAQSSGPASETSDPAAAKVADKGVKTVGSVKVNFDTGSDGVVVIESNGEKLRIDTVHKTVEKVGDTPTAPASATATEPKHDDGAAAATSSSKKDDKDKAYKFGKGWEPYDYRVVNVPTPKHVPKGSWNLVFTHRFTQPVRPLDESARNLLGLDSFGIASFGLSYGVTDKLYVSAYRSPVCQRGLCRDIEIGAGYNWIANDEKHPVAVTTYASIEGNDNFTEEHTFNLETMFAARVNKRVYLFFSPAVHINSNGQKRFNPRANEFFPPATTAVANFHLPTHGATFGFGGEVLVTPNVVLLIDVAARAGFKLGAIRPILDNNFRVTGFTNESHPSWGFGVQRNLGKHAFALTFSNTQTTTTARYNSSNVFRSWKFPIIGFNLSRRF